MSPKEAVAIEMLSPMMCVDVEMESPKVQSEDLFPQQEAGTFNSFNLKNVNVILFIPFFA